MAGRSVPGLIFSVERGPDSLGGVSSTQKMGPVSLGEDNFSVPEGRGSLPGCRGTVPEGPVTRFPGRVTENEGRR